MLQNPWQLPGQFPMNMNPFFNFSFNSNNNNNEMNGMNGVNE